MSVLANNNSLNKIIDWLIIISTFSILSILYFPIIKEIGTISWTDDDYSHGLLLPLVSIYMIKENWSLFIKKFNDSFLNPKNHALAFPLIGLLCGLFVFVLGTVSRISFTTWFSFFPVTLFLVYLLWGRVAYGFAFSPVCLLFMAKPLPDSLVVRLFWPLQVLAAQISAKLLEILQVPVYISGNIIEIPTMKLMVEEACSGMRSVMAMLTMALIVNYFSGMRITLKTLLLILALGVAVVMNVFRVAMTGVLAHFYDPQAATGFFHTFSGLIVFIIGLPVLYGLSLLLMNIDTKITAAKKTKNEIT